MLNPEMYLIIMPALGLTLFALGGTQISDKIKGQKWLRRFLLPFLWGLVIYISGGFHPWQAIAVAVISCALFHLGYGDKTPWLVKIGLFCAYGLISAPLGLSWWNIITAIGCCLMFLLSNIKPISETVVWKVVEGFFGAVIGVQIGFIMAGNGIIW